MDYLGMAFDDIRYQSVAVTDGTRSSVIVAVIGIVVKSNLKLKKHEG